MDAYVPVTSPSLLFDETLDKMIKDKKNRKVFLVSMPQTVSTEDLPTTIQLNNLGEITTIGIMPENVQNMEYYLRNAPLEINEHLRRSHALWTVVQGSAAPAPGKAVHVSKASRSFDGVWQVLLRPPQ